MHHDFTLVQKGITLVHKYAMRVLRLVKHYTLLRKATLMYLSQHVRLLSSIHHVDWRVEGQSLLLKGQVSGRVRTLETCIHHRSVVVTWCRTHIMSVLPWSVLLLMRLEEMLGWSWVSKHRWVYAISWFKQNNSGRCHIYTAPTLTLVEHLMHSVIDDWLLIENKRCLEISAVAALRHLRYLNEALRVHHRVLFRSQMIALIRILNLKVFFSPTLSKRAGWKGTDRPWQYGVRSVASPLATLAVLFVL